MNSKPIYTIDTGILNFAAIRFTDKFGLGDLVEAHTRLDRPDLFDPFDADNHAPSAVYRFANRPGFYLIQWNACTGMCDIYFGPGKNHGKTWEEIQPAARSLLEE